MSYSKKQQQQQKNYNSFSENLIGPSRYYKAYAISAFLLCANTVLSRAGAILACVSTTADHVRCGLRACWTSTTSKVVLVQLLRGLAIAQDMT